MKKGHVRLQVGSQVVDFVDFGQVTPNEFRELQVAQRQDPLRLAKIGARRFWLFQARVYWENDGLDADEVRALLVL